MNLDKNPRFRRCAAMALGFALITLLACGGPSDVPGTRQEQGSRRSPAALTRSASEPSSDDGELQLRTVSTDFGQIEEWAGDLDGMVERGFIRALVAYSKTFYFLDGGTQRGISYEGLREFEKYLNQQLGRRTLKVNVLIIPVHRDELLPALAQGLGDVAVANLTITPERQRLVDFSVPFATSVREVVVTGPSSPTLDHVDDLAGRAVHVRRSSSYWESLERLNEEFRNRGMQPVELVPAEEFLEDEDLLEMVNAGLLPLVIVDSHKADFWADIFNDIIVHDDVAVREGAAVAWAFRKDSPQFAEMLNGFVQQYRKGTLLTNVILKRYLQDNPWARNSLAETDRDRFDAMVHLFEEYGNRYDIDHLMLAALAYQESGLDQSKRSRQGAVGVMQMLPSTAADPNVDISNIDQLENNIHAGTKYLRFLHDRYFADEAMDEFNKLMFTFASYNAGPARVRRLRAEAVEMNLDPNQWFGNVEVVAARQIGRETVQYVSNIAKYYVAYRLVEAQRELKETAAGS
jgi:membrane-bound lytic murein transglycosylase MltF